MRAAESTLRVCRKTAAFTGGSATAARRLARGAVWHVAAGFALLLWLGWPLPGSAVEEDQVKAAFVYNFAKFTEWPPGVFASAEAPLVIGVVGSSAFARTLQTIVAQRKVGLRPVEIRQVGSAAEAAKVHVLFFDADAERDLPAFFEALQGRPVLTVGESAAFARQGGMINLVLVENKVRFEINLRRIQEAQLKLHAQLIKLALRVVQ